jgi:hypothetical protein
MRDGVNRCRLTPSDTEALPCSGPQQRGDRAIRKGAPTIFVSIATDNNPEHSHRLASVGWARVTMRNRLAVYKGGRLLNSRPVKRRIPESLPPCRDDMPASDWNAARERMLLDPSVTMLNTGSWGPVPRPVFDRVTEIRRELAAADGLLRSQAATDALGGPRTDGRVPRHGSASARVHLERVGGSAITGTRSNPRSTASRSS